MNITIINFLLNFFLIFTALMGVSTFIRKNSVFSVLSLIGTFFGGAVLMLINNAEFLSFIVLTVYIGAVAVLFLFIVMMVDLDRFHAIKNNMSEKLMATILALILLITFYNAFSMELKCKSELMETIIDQTIQSENSTWHASRNQIKDFGSILYDTKYSIAVVLVSLILISAIIGAIILSMRDSTGIKKQNSLDQMMANAKNTLTIKKVGFGQGVSDE